MRRKKGLRAWSAKKMLVALAAASIGLALGGVAITSASAGSKPTITLATNSWQGSDSNNVVAQYVIEKDLGYQVNLLTIDEIPTWPAMAKGSVSAVLEVWGHQNLYQEYVKGNHEVIDAGLEGPDGNIGWYVPTYLMKEHPELATWKGLEKDWKLFVTPQTTPKGQFLDGSPSYVTYDAAIISKLGLDLKVVYAGTEASQLAEVERIYKAHGAVLFYWYTPQYINALYSFSQIALPTFTQKCAADAGSNDQNWDCSYPPYNLYKAIEREAADDRTEGRGLHQALQLDVSRSERGRLRHHGEGHEPERRGEAVREHPQVAGSVLAERVVHQDVGAGSGDVILREPIRM